MLAASIAAATEVRNRAFIGIFSWQNRAAAHNYFYNGTEFLVVVAGHARAKDFNLARAVRRINNEPHPIVTARVMIAMSTSLLLRIGAS
jgi:hypothetical protein